MSEPYLRMYLARHPGVIATLLAIVGVICGMVLIMLQGCAPMQFSKAGATTAQLEADRYECEQQWERSSEAIAFRQDPMGNAFYGTQARSRMQACLEHKGWTRTQ